MIPTHTAVSDFDWVPDAPANADDADLIAVAATLSTIDDMRADARWLHACIASRATTDAPHDPKLGAMSKAIAEWLGGEA